MIKESNEMKISHSKADLLLLLQKVYFVLCHQGLCSENLWQQSFLIVFVFMRKEKKNKNNLVFPLPKVSSILLLPIVMKSYDI